MNQENNKYLSELFLNILGEDYSEKSVEKAVMQCNDELLSRFAHCNICSIIPCFMQQEMIDFIDVYSEFDELVNVNLKSSLLILNSIAGRESGT